MSDWLASRARARNIYKHAHTYLTEAQLDELLALTCIHGTLAVGGASLGGDVGAISAEGLWWQIRPDGTYAAD